MCICARERERERGGSHAFPRREPINSSVNVIIQRLTLKYISDKALDTYQCSPVTLLAKPAHRNPQIIFFQMHANSLI